MPLLRFTQSPLAGERFRVEVAWEGRGLPRQTATSDLTFALSDQDQENLRWYLEDFLQYPVDPAPEIAARIEQRIGEIGESLFRALLESTTDAHDLWVLARQQLTESRVEIVTGIGEANAIPWELIRDPKTATPLALRARSFVRAQPNPSQVPQLRQAESPIRILLVICRPRGGRDVPFRSVANRLIRGMGPEARAIMQLDVLRPPTFEQLSRVLRRAHAEGKPYHVVHFDGHGVYLEQQIEQEAGAMRQILRGLSSLVLAAGRTGKHGFLLFENPALDENLELVDGPRLGSLLVETGVPVLVLNACRSAHADAPPRPGEPVEAARTADKDDPHAKVRAFGSLAQEVMDAGVAGVVAMRYNVYVVTAAQFMADLYAALAQGDSLGEAATYGRKQLSAQPIREVGDLPRALQDWPVPVIYEAAPITLFKPPDKRLTISLGDLAAPVEGSLDPDLPPRPDAGFFGRDETLLALDRAFDRHPVVLLHAYAGSGKTATAAEFARWYLQTGGIDGAVLFSSFERHKPLARVLDHFGQTFGRLLESSGIHWLTLSDDQRKQLAIRVLAEVEVLWIWDNVESVAGFPEPSNSPWSPTEQAELAAFLKQCRDTKAKFLLTSRREERDWLGDLPVRLQVPHMPLLESFQLAQSLADRVGRRRLQMDAWRPLLRFSRGNPLALTTLTGLALRRRLETREEVEAFVDRLRSGEVEIEDDETLGRSTSLDASLSYGFNEAFDESERMRLALLYFFQGVVTVIVFEQLEDLLHAGRESWSPAEPAADLFDRAARIGLLQRGERQAVYSIHPALPWYFKKLFEQCYPDPVPTTRAFVMALAIWGAFLHDEQGESTDFSVAALSNDDANVLYACQLARRHGWWQEVIATSAALHRLYVHLGRSAEASRIVAAIAPDFIDLQTGDALAGREAWWHPITELRAKDSRNLGQYPLALDLAARLVASYRQAASATLEKQAGDLSESERKAIEKYAGSLNNYGSLQSEVGDPACLATLEEALALNQRIGDLGEAGRCAFHIGHIYSDSPGLDDLAKAEQFYLTALECRSREPVGRALALHELGQVAYKRFQQAAQRGDRDRALQSLQRAENYAQQALAALPAHAFNYMSYVHHLLGNIYDDAGQRDRALHHYFKAIHNCERQKDRLGAAKMRREVARSMFTSGRRDEALLYARAALQDLLPLGPTAVRDLEVTRRLIDTIESEMGGAAP